MEQETNTDTTRKLASIQLIDNIRPHPNADSLELVTVLGWQVCERIGAVKKGDTVVYCEIDSMLPGDAEWLPEAVKKRIDQQVNKEYHRLKTVKLRKEISQGLIIPIAEELIRVIGTELAVGTNVTGKLNIKKYEASAFSGKYELYKSNPALKFPTGVIDKTEETRVQSDPALFTSLKGKPYYASVKCDGTSSTFLYLEDTETGEFEFTVCSRNLIRERPDNTDTCPYWYVATKYNLSQRLEKFKHLAIQGEICGPGVQQNLLNLKDLQLFVFTVTDTRHRQKLPLNEMIKVCQELGLDTVPIEETDTSFDYKNIGELLKIAEGKYKGSKRDREGLVFRSLDQKTSFKVINNKYLLKKK